MGGFRHKSLERDRRCGSPCGINPTRHRLVARLLLEAQEFIGSDTTGIERDGTWRAGGRPVNYLRRIGVAPRWSWPRADPLIGKAVHRTALGLATREAYGSSSASLTPDRAYNRIGIGARMGTGHGKEPR